MDNYFRKLAWDLFSEYVSRWTTIVHETDKLYT